MKRKILLSLVLASLSFGAFAEEEYAFFDDISYEQDGIFHEMFLACVKTKSDCTTLAAQQGMAVLKVVTDRARCPQAPKTKACIVQH